MKNSLKEYIKYLENIKEVKDKQRLLEDLLIQIKFYQHERLVHFLVTIFVGISCILFLMSFVAFEMIGFGILFFITLFLFIPYIFHYYTLENGVQRLYKIYFDIKEKK
jgi:hypothetical protein